MQALIARVDLARIDLPEPAPGKPAPAAPRLPEPLLADVREQAARADREITDGYERQAVITAAAYLLERAGLGAESDALLKANLAKSHSPYYLMSGLASNAKKRGDKAEALRWYREAFEKSEGPATRLQWGASYVGALVDLAPADEAAIESDHACSSCARRRRSPTPSTSAAPARWSGSARSCRPGTRAARTRAAMTRLRGELDDALRRRRAAATPSARLRCKLAALTPAGDQAKRLPRCRRARCSVEHLSVRFGATRGRRRRLVRDSTRARSSRSSANRARASRSRRCRCSAWSTAPRRAARSVFAGARPAAGRRAASCARCAAARSR